MHGEFGIKIKKIAISKPHYNDNNEPYFELQLVNENNEFLWICGDNDIPKLMREALKDYYKNKKKGDK